MELISEHRCFGGVRAYYLVLTFMEDHLTFHQRALHG